MKTFEELLATGTQAELAAALADNTKKAGAIFAKSAASVEEIEEATALDEQCTKIEVKMAELKKVADAKSRNDSRTKAMNTVADTIPHDAGETKTTPPQYAFSSLGSLKHITFGASRQENELTAYRFYQYFAATSLKNQKAFDYCKANGIPLVLEGGGELKTVNEGNNNQGGALVPPEFDATLIRLIETYGVFRKYAMLSPMARETKVQPRRTGGVTAYWVKEAGSITASNPTYDNVELVAKKLAALCAMSSEIDEDSAISIADQLAFEIGYAFAQAEDNAGFIGDGSNTYGGITGVTTKLKGLNSTIAYIAGLFVGTGNAYSELVLADFNSTVGLLPQYADPNAAWYVHKSFFHTVMQRLELAAGGATPNEISAGDRRGRPLFLGYPVNFCQVMPRTEANSQVCALFGDLAMAATFGDRRTRTIATDPYSLFTTDMIQVRGTERIDINVHDVGNANSSAGSRVAGPIVGLITAAS